MNVLKDEIDNVIKNDFKLNFKIPTEEEMINLRTINKDSNSEDTFTREVRKLKKEGATAEDLQQLILDLYKN